MVNLVWSYTLSLLVIKERKSWKRRSEEIHSLNFYHLIFETLSITITILYGGDQEAVNIKIGYNVNISRKCKRGFFNLCQILSQKFINKNKNYSYS